MRVLRELGSVTGFATAWLTAVAISSPTEAQQGELSYSVRAFTYAHIVGTTDDNTRCDEDDTGLLQEPSASSASFCVDPRDGRTVESSAFADLTTGEVGAFAEAGPFVSGRQTEGAGGGSFRETLTLNVPGGVDLPITIGATFHLEGSIDENCCDGANGVAQGGFSISEVDASGSPIAGQDSASFSLQPTGVFSESFPLAIDYQGLGDVRIQAFVMVTAANGAIADFSNTASVSLQLPEGVTFESASGVFLTDGGTPLPVFECVGFEPPMDQAVTARKNRALPLKAALLDGSDPVTDVEIAAPPVVVVEFQSSSSSDPEPIDAEPVGMSSEGNQFLFDPVDHEWHFNLCTQEFSAPGTYMIRMASGDSGEYAINPTCETTFVMLE